MTRKEALVKLAESEGYASIDDLLLASSIDSIVPAICMICATTGEMEPDQDRGYCDGCGANAMKSALVLAGLI
jgi:hypothetical protein